MSAGCFILMLLVFITIPTLIYTFCHVLKRPPTTPPRHGGKKAAEAAVVRRMELVTVVDVARLLEEARGDCSVCLSGFEEGEELWRLKLCSHLFHAPCIEPWLRSRSSCPVCRAYVLFTDPPMPIPQAAAPERERHLWQGLPDSTGLV